MLSVITDREGDVVYIHADADGLAQLERTVSFLKRGLESGKCEHDHLFSQAWGGRELTETMLQKERDANCKQVHHVKLYAWSSEWRERHAL